MLILLMWAWLTALLVALWLLPGQTRQLLDQMWLGSGPIGGRG